jgi:hypothetical protein
MKLVKATETEIQQFIAQHVAWSENNKLHCQYVFNDFIDRRSRHRWGECFLKIRVNTQ